MRIRVVAAGVTPADARLRSGALREVAPLSLPHVPGVDAAGVVDEVGPGAEGVAVGDAVFGYTAPAAAGGATAQYAVLDAWAAKPAEWNWLEAGGAAANIETATRVLNALDVGAGHTLLIEGAAGGVGTTTVQLAIARGARVIGTASTSNHATLRKLGAVPTEYGTGLVDRVRALVPEGVDRVLDAAGSGSLPELVTIAGRPDRVVTVADMKAAEHGVRLSYTAGPGGAMPAGAGALQDAVELANAGKLRVLIDSVHRLDSAADAHRTIETGHAQGKVVVKVSPDLPS